MGDDDDKGALLLSIISSSLSLLPEPASGDVFDLCGILKLLDFKVDGNEKAKFASMLDVEDKGGVFGFPLA
jgi:hypothetical protein